jgi:hypothetical protein
MASTLYSSEPWTMTGLDRVNLGCDGSESVAAGFRFSTGKTGCTFIYMGSSCLYAFVPMRSMILKGPRNFSHSLQHWQSVMRFCEEM